MAVSKESVPFTDGNIFSVEGCRGPSGSTMFRSSQICIQIGSTDFGFASKPDPRKPPDIWLDLYLLLDPLHLYRVVGY